MEDDGDVEINVVEHWQDIWWRYWQL